MKKPQKTVGLNSRDVMIISGAAVAAIIGLALVVFPTYTGAGMEKPSTDVTKELSRLASLTSKEEIQASDLEQLKAMLASNEGAQHELGEIEELVSYGEYEHAAHSFAFLASHLETGLETVCPGHELAHYYVYTRHGNVEGAGHKLEHAKETFEAWEHGAREFYEKYPGDVPFDYIVDKVKSHILAIEAGQTETTDEEIDFLADRTVCIQADAEHPGAHEDGSDEAHETAAEAGEEGAH